jgi:branched-chain amino acid transport system substrate-binding protein
MSQEAMVKFQVTIEEFADRKWSITVETIAGARSESATYSLPALPPQLLTAYDNWRAGYLDIGEPTRFDLRVISIPEVSIETNVSNWVNDDSLRNILIAEFNQWLSSNPKLSQFVRDKVQEIKRLRTQVGNSEYQDGYFLLLQRKITNQNTKALIEKLPWNEWEDISPLTLQTGVVLSYPHNDSLISLPPQPLKAIVICGKYRNPNNQIDTERDLQYIVTYLKNVEIVPWFANSQKSKQENLEALIAHLEENNYHLLFFCGHSTSTERRRIYLDDVGYIDVGDNYFKRILIDLKDRGLIFAFFNSCDGLGIAQILTSVGIPYVAVMKEPVHDVVAQNFMRLFLKKAVESNKPLHIAFNLARMQLRADANLPDGDFLPVLFKKDGESFLYLNPSSPEEEKTIDTARSTVFQKMKIFIYIGLAIFALLIVTLLPIYLRLFTPSICQFAASADKISCGEEILIEDRNGLRPNKEEGFELIKKGINNPSTYQEAIKKLEKDWSDNYDPETGIAIENAKIADELRVNPNLKVKNIAVVVPAKTNTPSFVANTILKGVVYLQQQHNQNSKDWKLRLLIADDGNDPAKGVNIARQLATRSDLLGIIGHYSSNVTVPILEKKIYDDKIVLVSPTATSHELTNKSNNTSFFRVVPSSEVAAADMVKNWVNPQRKIALFYVDSKKFSFSLAQMFEKEVSKKYGDNIILVKIDLEKSTNIKKEIDNLSYKQVKEIVLFPDAYTGNPNLNKKWLDVIAYNQGKLPILGNTSIYDSYNQFEMEAIKPKPKLYQNIVVSVPWKHFNISRYPQTLTVSEKASALPQIPTWWLNKSKSIDNLNQRIAMSYDAALVLVTALENADNFQQVRRAILNKNVVLEGLTGKISFNGSDRAQNINSLIMPDCNSDRCEGWKVYQPESNP